MSDPSPAFTHAVQATLDREVALLQSAVDLVAAGGAPSATVAGLRLCEAAMDIVRPTAHDLGIDLEPLWNADESGCDVRVHREAMA
jgi:hypothetical protein